MLLALRLFMKGPFMISLQLSLIFPLFMCICIFEFCSIKPSHFTESKIYVKLDPKAAEAAHTLIIKNLVPFTNNDTIYLRILSTNY